MNSKLDAWYRERDPNLPNFMVMNSNPEIPEIQDPAIELSRDACTEKSAILRCVHRKNWTAGSWISGISAALFMHFGFQQIWIRILQLSIRVNLICHSISQLSLNFALMSAPISYKYDWTVSFCSFVSYLLCFWSQL